MPIFTCKAADRGDRCGSNVGSVPHAGRTRAWDIHSPRVPSATEIETGLRIAIAYLPAGRICFGTLDSACSAIAHRHHQEGLPDPTPTSSCDASAADCAASWALHRAGPLTVGELDRLVSSIDPLSAIGVRDRAVILLGYASALRPGELSALDFADIITKPTGVLVAVRRSKTDQDGYGQLVGVARGKHRLEFAGRSAIEPGRASRFGDGKTSHVSADTFATAVTTTSPSHGSPGAERCPELGHEARDRDELSDDHGCLLPAHRDRGPGGKPAGEPAEHVSPEALAEMVSDLRDARFRVIAKLEGAAFEQWLADLTEVVLRVVYGATQA